MSNQIIVNGVDVTEKLEKQERLLDLYRELKQMNECIIIYLHVPYLPYRTEAIETFNDMGGGVRKQELLKEIKKLEIEK